MTETATPKSQNIPAYVPYATFRSFLARLKGAVVPNKIDYSAMPEGMAGGTKGQLRSSLRFLGLIEEDGTARPALRALVEAFETEAWQTALFQHLMPAYLPIMDEGDFDFEKATPQQLEARFKAVGAGSNETTEKALRFFLQAAQEAGVPISPLIVKPNPNGSGMLTPTRRRRKPRPGAAAQDSGDQGKVETHLEPGYVKHVFLLRKGTPIHVALPEDLTMAEVERFAAWLKTIPLPDEA